MEKKEPESKRGLLSFPLFPIPCSAGAYARCRLTSCRSRGRTTFLLRQSRIPAYQVLVVGTVDWEATSYQARPGMSTWKARQERAQDNKSLDQEMYLGLKM